jgi:hypothetical protein
MWIDLWQEKVDQRKQQLELGVNSTLDKEADTLTFEYTHDGDESLALKKSLGADDYLPEAEQSIETFNELTTHLLSQNEMTI